MNGSRAWRLLSIASLAVVAAATIASASLDGAGVWTSAGAETLADKLGMAARAGALGLAMIAWSRGRAAVAWTGGALLASLVFRAALLPCVLVCGAAMVAAERRDKTAAVLLGPAVVTATLLALAVARGSSSTLDSSAERSSTLDAAVDPAAQVARERARGNPYRAHAAAFSWARAEAPPGEGHLALAAVDVDLHRPEKAAKVLDKILEGATDESIRARARTLRARIDGAVREP